MKTTKQVLLLFLSVSLVFLSSCKDDPVEIVSPFIGDYVISKATLKENLTLITNELPDPMTLVAGLDITPMIQTALVGAIDCEPESSLIELREDFSLYLGCLIGTSDELDGGTWEEQSDTVVILNLNSTAIPSSPTGIVLTVNDVTLVGNILSGETTVPISRDMLVGVLADMSGGRLTLDMDATPVAVLITFEIELEKQ